MILALLLSWVSAQPAPSFENAWAAPAGDAVAVYATLSNPSMYDLYVVSGTSDAGAAVALRDGEKAVTSLTVPAYGSLELKPGGAHVRVLEVKRPLKPGDEVTLTLETDGGVAIAIAAIVK